MGLTECHSCRAFSSAGIFFCILQEKEKQDLIFVDGRRRVECVVAALQAIRPRGVILLHDVNRKAYTDLIRPFIEVIEHAKNTLVFRPRDSLQMVSGAPTPVAAS